MTCRTTHDKFLNFRLAVMLYISFFIGGLGCVCVCVGGGGADGLREGCVTIRIILFYLEWLFACNEHAWCNLKVTLQS